MEKSNVAMMAGALYDALKSAGAEDEKARKAAEEVADYDSEIRNIRMDLSTIRADLHVLKWANGVIVAGVVALVLKALL